MIDAATNMTSHRPYLLRALHQWITDNDMTPHLLVDATLPGVQVPAQAVDQGRVVLNIAARAVAGLQIGDEGVSFTARFGGVSQAVWVPATAVLAIYARETGQGMALPAESVDADRPSEPDAPPVSAEDTAGAGRRAHLRVIK